MLVIWYLNIGICSLAYPAVIVSYLSDTSYTTPEQLLHFYSTSLKHRFRCFILFLDHVADPKPGFFSGAWSGLKLMLIIVLVCVALVVVGVVGFLVFQKQQDNARKRFYWLLALPHCNRQLLNGTLHWLLSIY